MVALADKDGKAFATYRYDAWGNPIESTTATTTSIPTTSAVANIAARQVLRYAGYCWDAESKMYYCSARTYDPATRQFTSKDPAKADGEESAYQYCGGDPVGKVDPSGRVWWDTGVRWFGSDLLKVMRLQKVKTPRGYYVVTTFGFMNVRGYYRFRYNTTTGRLIVDVQIDYRLSADYDDWNVMARFRRSHKGPVRHMDRNRQGSMSGSGWSHRAWRVRYDAYWVHEIALSASLWLNNTDGGTRSDATPPWWSVHNPFGLTRAEARKRAARQTAPCH